jgi:hypothetical protein
MPTIQDDCVFPVHIDRARFGDWLSGFSDGEACFFLGYNTAYYKGKKYSHPCARFVIALRDDDLETLKLIKGFWQCGSIYSYAMKRCRDIAVYQVFKIDDLTIVMKHFQKHPLLSKKAQGFSIWTKGILLVEKVRNLPSLPNGNRGTLPKWAPEYKEQYERLIAALKDSRAYKSRNLAESLSQLP